RPFFESLEDRVTPAAVLGGALANQAVNDNATLAPFANFTIANDSAPDQNLTVTVQPNTAYNGVFSTLNGFTDAGEGKYTFSGTAAQAQTAIRGLVFDPSDNQVAPGQTVTTTLTVKADDGLTPVSDNGTTVVATSINDAPVLGGAMATEVSGGRNV